MRGLKITGSILLAGLVAGLFGCTSGRVVQNYNKSVQQGDGILLVVVDTQVPVSYLLLKRKDQVLTVTEISKFKKGRSVRFMELPAGTYEWTQVHLGQAGGSMGFMDYYLTMKDADRKYFTFTVKPGVTNYPGDFVINVKSLRWTDILAALLGGTLFNVGHRYYLQLIDRDAMMQEMLTPPQRRMVKRLGMAYVGPGNDAFPAFYRSLTMQQGGAK